MRSGRHENDAGTSGIALEAGGAVRLQRLLARAGVASRRRAEALITAGRVRVNGRVVTELGARADPTVDDVTVDCRPVRLPKEHAYLALHKPAGYVTTVRDPQGRPTVMSLVPPIRGLVPVGRLDLESEGLLLLTTDGEWAQRVGHPRYGSTKEYLVDVRGVPSLAALDRLRRPLDLGPDGRTTGAEVELLAAAGDRARLRLTLHEGRHRQVRRMLDLVGHPVQRLVRVRVGAVRLGRLKPGAWRQLTPREIAGAGARLTIAIDGPAASGKSTLGAALAERLGYTYFDTGVMYRALTWLALRRGIDAHDGARLARLAQQARVAVVPPTQADGRQYTVLVDGEDVTWASRSPDVDRNVSPVSAHPEVRAALIDQQRRLAAGGGIVMVGRDIGTVVLPDADLKIFLTASPQERARRRSREQAARGAPADYEEILADMRRRDAIDSGREAAPLRPAADAVVLDSDQMTVEEEVEFVLRLLAQRAAEAPTPSAASGRRTEHE